MSRPTPEITSSARYSGWFVDQLLTARDREFDQRRAVCYSQGMHASRVACVGRVRWIALAGLVAGGVVFASRSSPPELTEPTFACVMPLAVQVEPAPVEPPEYETLLGESERPICSCAPIVDGEFTTEQLRTLELACRLYSDDQCRHSFELFATPKHPPGDLTAVIVKRSTGDCGGCGALAVAAVFERGKLEAIGELGRFGRMGNGPDAVSWVEVAGEPALRVTSSTSMGGSSYQHEEYFLRHGNGFKNGLCLISAHDDQGAHENYSSWDSKIKHHPDGAISVHYRAIRRGEYMPKLDPVTVGFDRGARIWISDRSDGQCVAPVEPSLIDI
jgi:hypothetical protein